MDVAKALDSKSSRYSTSTEVRAPARGALKMAPSPAAVPASMNWPRSDCGILKKLQIVDATPEPICETGPS